MHHPRRRNGCSVAAACRRLRGSVCRLFPSKRTSLDSIGPNPKPLHCHSPRTTDGRPGVRSSLHLRRRRRQRHRHRNRRQQSTLPSSLPLRCLRHQNLPNLGCRGPTQGSPTRRSPTPKRQTLPPTSTKSVHSRISTAWSLPSFSRPPPHSLSWTMSLSTHGPRTSHRLRHLASLISRSATPSCRRLTTMRRLYLYPCFHPLSSRSSVTICI